MNARKPGRDERRRSTVRLAIRAGLLFLAFHVLIALIREAVTHDYSDGPDQFIPSPSVSEPTVQPTDAESKPPMGEEQYIKYWQSQPVWPTSAINIVTFGWQTCNDIQRYGLERTSVMLATTYDVDMVNKILDSVTLYLCIDKRDEYRKWVGE